MKKRLLLCTLALSLTVGLAGCTGSGSSSKDADAGAAMTSFLDALKSGDSATANVYMEDDNELAHVFAATTGESVPELDDVYKKFFQQMSDATYQVTLEDEKYGTVKVQAQTKDFATSIHTAMDQALQTQATQGGDAFSNIAGWLSTGLDTAVMGESQELSGIMAGKNGGYYVQHEGSPNQTFMNGVTGGFYDYADLTMTVCTSPADSEYPYTYYLASLGDKVIGYLAEMEDSLASAQITQEDFDLVREQYLAMFEGQEGIYADIRLSGDKVLTTMGIDFDSADSSFLVNSGLVSGAYDTSFGEYLSLSSTINGFESDGMTCVTTPVYDKE